jgi:hypothetical protein
MWFLKEHLLVKYEWSTDGQQMQYTGSPSRRTFNRYNGNQVLYLINLYGSLSERLTINDGRKMETLLINNLPLDVMSEISAFNWLRNCYNTISEQGIALPA